MVFLGIDPGIADTGYGLIEAGGGKERSLAYGSIRTSASSPPAERLRRLYERLEEIVAAHRPAAAAVEKIYFSKNVKTAISVAEARGVVRLCLARNGIVCREFNPADVKLAVCGYGGASKEQVQRMVRSLLKLREIPRPDDAADALAVAIALAQTKVFGRAA